MKAANKILVVEPESYVRDSLETILSTSGYGVVTAESGPEAFNILENEKIALIIADFQLNGMSGDDLLTYLQQKHDGIDVIITTAYPDVSIASRVIEKGAFDLLYKPFHSFQLLLTVKRAFEKRKLIVESKDFQFLLEKKIKEQTLSLRLRNQEKQQLLINTIKSLVQTLEAKDKYTEGHSRRVAENSLQIAQNLGFEYREQEEIHLAGLLHDIGKIGIKESILNKRGRLTEQEYTHIKTHPLVSQRILEPIPQFKRVVSIIRHHHEFYDGSGYPDGLKGKTIPAGARILAICDAYDAMTSDRSYRAALPDDKAFDILSRNRGSQFDPRFVEVFYHIKGRTLPQN